LLSVTEPIDPLEAASVTVPPLEVKLLPEASLSCTVIVVVDVPLATIEFEAAEMVEVAKLAGPGIKFTVSVSVISEPLSLPVMVAISTVELDVNVAV
jgi:hypothetical protein